MAKKFPAAFLTTPRPLTFAEKCDECRERILRSYDKHIRAVDEILAEPPYESQPYRIPAKYLVQRRNSRLVRWMPAIVLELAAFVVPVLVMRACS